MNKYEIVEQKKNIEDMIFEMRGVQVIIDSDVAYLYKTETKKVNQIVKRNKGRFPVEFCFQLTEDEFSKMVFLRSQIVTSKSMLERRGGRQYLPYVFTEQGIAMLSGLIKNDTAVMVSVNIMNAFVGMRKFISANMNILARLDNYDKQFLDNKVKLLEHDNSINKLFSKLNNKTEVKEKIFFNGQIYDAYSLLVDIIKKAKKSIILIDNYVNKETLDILSNKLDRVEVLLVTSNKCKLKELDMEKFNKQYPTLSIRYNNNFHDRFIILDNKVLYHCGASVKDVGSKCFGINKVKDSKYLSLIIKEINTYE